MHGAAEMAPSILSRLAGGHRSCEVETRGNAAGAFKSTGTQDPLLEDYPHHHERANRPLGIDKACLFRKRL